MAVNVAKEIQEDKVAAVRADPGDYKAHYNLGIIFDDQGRVAEAVAHHQIARNLDPERQKSRQLIARGARAHYMQGIRSAAGSREAVKHFRKSCDLGDPKGCRQLAKLLDRNR